MDGLITKHEVPLGHKSALARLRRLRNQDGNSSDSINNDLDCVFGELPVVRRVTKKKTNKQVLDTRLELIKECTSLSRKSLPESPEPRWKFKIECEEMQIEDSDD